MRPYREIIVADVGQPFFRAFGKTWQACDFIGRVMPQDVGKRVYQVGGILQVENDKQRADRLAKLSPDEHQGVWYWQFYEQARGYAVAHGYPTDRIIAYARGWAIQLSVSGPYVGPEGKQ